MSGAWQNCCCSECYNTGAFVYAEKELTGWPSIAWEVFPKFFTKLYRKIFIHHDIDIYYPDLSNPGAWLFWKTYTVEFTYILSEDCSSVIYTSIVGSLNGLIYEHDVCSGDPPFTKDFPGDWIFETDPNGDGGYSDIPPAYGVGGGIGSLISVSEDTVVSELRVNDANGALSHLTTTTVQMLEHINPAKIQEEIAEMLATKPLGTALQGHYIILTKNGDCCAAAGIEEEVSIVSTRDDYCGCMNVAGHSQDRRITWQPAAFDYTMPGSGSETGAGTLRSVADWVYGASLEWLFDAGSGLFILHTTSNIPGSVEAAGWGKKAWLMRLEPEQYVVMFLKDEDGNYILPGTCMREEPTTECERYYYPEGSDSGGSSGDYYNFVLTGRGEIYRSIIPFTSEMQPVPCDTEIACPAGQYLDEWIDLPGDNPCLP